MPSLEVEPVPSEVKQGPRVPLSDDVVKIVDDEDEARGKGRIRCPRCGWQPGPSDLWMCRCGCAWNTFDTGGRCPDCGRRWLKTQCLLCGEWSPHDAWYV